MDMGQISQEPSMEDILASIKRIIAEDSESVGARPPRPRRETAANEAARPAAVRPVPRIVSPEPEIDACDDADAEDVLELTSPLVPEIAAMPAEAPVSTAPAAAPAPAAPAEDIMSDPARQASRNAFAALAQQRAAPRPEATAGSPIEAFLADMLKPMLKDWLDRELPGIVERLVAAEIQKVSGRG